MPSFACDQCKMVFSERHNRNRHRRTAHGEDKKTFRCTNCFKKYSRREDLRHHNKSCKSSWWCEDCGQAFSQLLHYNRHRSKAHRPLGKRKAATQNPVGEEKKARPSTATSTGYESDPAKKPGTRTSDTEEKNHRPSTACFTGQEIELEKKSKQETRTSDGKERKARPMTATTTRRGVDPAEKRTQASGVEVKRTDPVKFEARLLDTEEEEDVVFIYEEHWTTIRTHHTVNRSVQDVYNFRHEEPSLRGLEEELSTTIFKQQQWKFKINLSYGFILRSNDSEELRYFHASQNNARVLDSPKLIGNEADWNSFMEESLEEDVLEWARQKRPNSKWVVHRITNVTFYINKIKDHPIGAPQYLPDYIMNNKAIVALVKDENNNFYYKDNLCLFRCLALLNGATYHNLNSTTDALYHRYTDISKGVFSGVRLNQLPEVEEIFEVNISVFELRKNEDEVVARIVRRSARRYAETMYVNLYKNHFSYIKDINQYSKSFACRKCDKLWKTVWYLNRHEKTCTDEVNYQYVGGVYATEETVFDKLDDEGIHVAEQDRYYPYRATFDFESYFDKTSLPSDSANVTWEAKHTPLSVSVCSNVPVYDEPVCFITEGDSQVLVARMMNYLKNIAEHAKELLRMKFASVFSQLETRIADTLILESLATGEETEKKHPTEKLYDQLDAYLKEMPVVGFNSGKYDINIVKRELLTYLKKHQDIEFVVKKTNNFMCLKTGQMIFLDVVNYLAPGFSYDKFLKAFGCTITKGFLPYEYLDSLVKLDDDHLPSHEAFYSSLKKTNISNEDYTYCQRVWDEEKMTTLRDFLIWYNNRDVKPFIEALEKQHSFYRERGLDMFKQGISVPGLTLRYLFSTLDRRVYFTIFNEKNSDLHHLMKENIVGGPSIIFHRYHEKSITGLRTAVYGEHSKTCGGIVGFDANALYLWSLMQEMPTGWYVRRRKENMFRPEIQHRYGRMAEQWLEYIADRDKIHIRHQFNGIEKTIGRRQLPVDGWCRATKTCYQFHGCFWHGHQCHLNQKNGEPVIFNRVREKSMADLFDTTQRNSSYIKDLGYNLVELWECEWQEMKRKNKELRDFLRNYYQQETLKGALSETELLHHIKTNDIFGLVQCDIHVPDHLKPHFSEMTPIFKNIDISREDIGEHMKTFAEKHDLLRKPRRSLIGSYHGEKILLATPLLKWYLEHGLIVDRIYQVIEYEAKQCFQEFGQRVSDARRQGDSDPDCAILADTMKLLGNCGYGKTVTNKEKHRNVCFCDEEQATNAINSKRFRQLNTLGDNLYEVEMNKKTIKLDLPLTIGFFVYQFAKLRMLQFYYDFMDKYIDRRDFEYCEMDTDSAYIALSTPALEDLIRPELKRDYFQDIHKWFPSESCERHREAYIEAKTREEVWIPEPCCTQRKIFDKRTPGLFKIEWQGEGIVSLCSKTYYCFGTKNKVSCKGISKRHTDLTKEKYMAVLEKQQSGSGINRGFRIKDNTMYTYTQSREALTYFYPKRCVSENCVSTSALKI